MSTETLLPAAQVLPPGHPASPAVVMAATCPPPTASLQERRLRAARELDGRIRRLEQDTLQLAAALESARQRARDHLGELQQRSTSLTTEVLRVGARLARQGRDQDEQRRQLEHRLGQRLRELETALQPLAEALRTQGEQLADLQARHDTLTRLHEHLDRIVSRQGRGLDIVAAEFGQRVELLRVSLEGMQALFRDQQQSQMRIAVEQESLSALTRNLQARIDDSLAELQQHREHTRRQLQRLTSLLAVLALVSLGLLAWFQFHPLTLPATARQQLASLGNQLSLQGNSTARLERTMDQQAATLANLHREVQQAHRDNLRLRGQARQQQTRLARMAARLAAALPRAGAGSRAATATGEKGSSAAHWATPAEAPIPLPAALPGSGPDI